MCGRFTLILEPEAVQKELDLGDFPPDFQPRYNIAPTQPIAVVNDPVNRDVKLFRWGLIPSWAKDPAVGNRMINARSETLIEKPSFRTAFTRRRCIILADGFYEWQRPEGEKSSKKSDRSTPYYFSLADRKPFAFAGLWDIWRSPQQEEVYSCTIITCEANELVGNAHNRMPVILDRSSLWHWLDPKASIPELQSLLIPYSSARMSAQPVSRSVNNPAFDSPECIAPLTEPED